MKITRIKKGQIRAGDIVYILGVSLKSDYEKKKLDDLFKKLNSENIVPVEKLESFFEEELVFFATKIKTNQKDAKYEVLFVVGGKEDKVKRVIEPIKQFVKEQEEKKSRKKK